MAPEIPPILPIKPPKKVEAKIKGVEHNHKTK